MDALAGHKHILAVSAVAVLVVALWKFCGQNHPMPLPQVFPPTSEDVVVSPLTALNNGRWIRSFRTVDGTLYLHGKLLSRDGGRTVEPQVAVDMEEITAAPERAALARPGLFYALDGPVELESPGIYRVRSWRSTDDLHTLVTENVRIEVPDGPTRLRQGDEWFGLYVYRTILEMPDGSWRLTVYGNFAVDTLPPLDRFSQIEVKYKMRSLLLTSRDQGRSWQYLATIAAPRDGDPVGEGFVEPALTRLPDGRLLCVMRTGHYFPLYACWSSDGGKSWTAPVYTGLDRGCDPCLITLADGRVALSWGRRFPEGWSQLDNEGDAVRFHYPGVSLLNLALSSDGGASWVNHPIVQNVGSGYSTLVEVEPGVLFFQVDQWIGRITLHPREAIVAHERPVDQ